MVDFSSPYLSLYSIPAVWVTVIYPAAAKLMLYQRALGRYDNVLPRGNLAALEEKKDVSEDVKACAARMEGAHANGHEIFPLWAASVIIGNYAGLDPYVLNSVAATFVVFRAVYDIIYINASTAPQSYVRSFVWATGLFMPLYLLLLAVNKLRTDAGVL